ncbi:MAG TPA: SDR family oxidoreductase [Candidatus Nanoarchaeia archaeon]|nr:SDR family oxidoreductase [Candidatus Nanoarchaeia archaeon]
MAKVLVTGGAGFIGSHLVEELAAKGHQVTVFDNLTTGKQENLAAVKDKITFIKGDISDVNLLKKAFAKQEYVFHLAAIASVPFSVEHPLETHEINTTGTLKVLIAARDAKVKRVIYSSSAAVYGDEPTLPKTETSTLKPQTPYALTKLTGEQYTIMFSTLYGIETVALRYFNVYGPRQDPKSPYSGVITKFITALKNKNSPTIFGTGIQTRDFVYVKDVVQANIKAMTANASGKVFNIASGVQVSIREMLEHLNEILGTKISPKMAPRQPGDILHSVADISEAKKTLNFSPTTTFHEGLEWTVKS